MVTTSHVYVIGPIAGPQKVGFAADPQRRLGALQTGAAFGLLLHSTLEVPAADAGEVESRAHAMMANRHRRGEWFDVTPEQAAIVVRAAWRAVQSGAEREPALRRRNVRRDGLKSLHLTGSLTDRQYAAGLYFRRMSELVAKFDRTGVRQPDERSQAARQWLADTMKQITADHGVAVRTAMTAVVGRGRTVSSIVKGGRRHQAMIQAIAKSLDEVWRRSSLDIVAETA